MTRRLAILVTGSREYGAVPEQRDRMAQKLRAAAQGYDPRDVYLIHGDYEGADALADELGRAFCWTVLPCPAPWRRMGSKAGPERNTGMVLVMRFLRWCGYECKVLAFPLRKSVGTWDCREKAVDEGFVVDVIVDGS